MPVNYSSGNGTDLRIKRPSDVLPRWEILHVHDKHIVGKLFEHLTFGVVYVPLHPGVMQFK